MRSSLSAISPEAAQGRAYAEMLLSSCDVQGRLPEGARQEVQALVGMLEARLA